MGRFYPGMETWRFQKQLTRIADTNYKHELHELGRISLEENIDCKKYL